MPAKPERDTPGESNPSIEVLTRKQKMISQRKSAYCNDTAKKRFHDPIQLGSMVSIEWNAHSPQKGDILRQPFILGTVSEDGGP